MEQLRTTTKIMMVRTLFNPNVPRITNLYKTLQKILHLNGEIVILHPSDGKRVLRALKYFVNEVDIVRLNELVASREDRIRSRI